jgi:hypothetical protein
MSAPIGVPTATRSIAFILPRADWIASNLSLMKRLARDPDIDVILVGPAGFRLDGAESIVSIEYPFYHPRSNGSFLSRCRETYEVSRGRRAIIDRVFNAIRPDCIVVISDTSRESVPFVGIARRRGVTVVFMQSVFLASPLRRHVRSENWTMARRRGALGILYLIGIRAIHFAAGLPATVFKSSAVGGYSDAVFVINEDQKRVFLETTRPDRIHVTGTPFVDFLHRAVHEQQDDGRAAFCRELDCNPADPIVAYFSKSLEQFCQADPAVERRAQEFFINAALDELPNATVIVKLHPIEDDRAFRKFAGHPRVRIVKEADVHRLIHHSALVVSLGPSTPAFHSVFHDRPRLVITRIDDIVLDYQRDLLDVSVCVRSRDEYVAALRRLRAAGWPKSIDPRFVIASASLARFTTMFDGLATERAYAGLRRFLGLEVPA